MTISDDRVAQFAELAYERMRIYTKKELGFPKPWTDKPVFMDSFFCNVFRQLDKTSKWIMQNVIEPNMDDNYLWAMLVVARYISRIDCLEQLRDAGAFDGSYDIADRLMIVRTQMLKRRAIGLPLNTGAFITSPMLGEWGPTKAHYIVHLVEALMDEGDGLGFELEYADATMEGIHTGLMEFRGVGSFMAYQYCCDFSYVDRYLGKAPDLNTWSAIGPGSRRGINRLIFGTPYERIPTGEWLGYVNELHEKWYQYVTGSVKGRDYYSVSNALIQELTDSIDKEVENGLSIGERSSSRARIESFVPETVGMFLGLRMQDVQHWLCEYDKYMRGGSSKRRYDGRAT